MKTETKISEENLGNLAMILRITALFLLVGLLIYLVLNYVGRI